jgi:tRNA (uracil-5-)-methyltransferase
MCKTLLLSSPLLSAIVAGAKVSGPSSLGRGGCRAMVSMVSGRRKRRLTGAEGGAVRTPVALDRTAGGVPAIAQCHPERYDELLAEKVASLEQLLEAATRRRQPAALPRVEVHESARSLFRMRADFSMWREPDESVVYTMFNREDKRTPCEVREYPMGSALINELMGPLRDALGASRALRQRLGDVRFLTTTTGEALVTITYNRPIGEEWRDAAAPLAQELGIKIVGRSRKVKIVVGGDETVQERLRVPNRGELRYTQTEGAFAQPNAGVCEQMLGWAYAEIAVDIAPRRG